MCRLLGHYLHLKLGEKIVPAQGTPYDASLMKQGRDWLIEDLGASPLSIATPDGIRLDGVHIPGKKEGKKVSPQAPTLILFNGNGERYECAHGFLETTVESRGEKVTVAYPISNISDFVALGYNVVLFNYRGVGKSEGRATRDGLILDGDSILQYVLKRCRVPEEQVILFGHSLGGGVATQVAALHSKVNLCHVRSFASLEKEVRVIFGRIAPWMGIAAAKIVTALSWVLDTAAKWDQVKGRKWIVYHPEDPVIPFDASQFKELQERRSPCPAVVLKNQEAVRAFCEKQAEEEKKRALTPGEKKLVEDAAKEFSDPHNRALLPEEVKEIVALWA